MNVIIILLSFLILFVLCVLWVILVNINNELAKTLNQVLENIDNFCVEQKRKYEQ